jgi:hypothetical protein
MFSDEEIVATRRRFAAVQQAARALDAKFVVRDWKTWTAPDGRKASQYLAEQNGGSLFARDFAQFCPEACKPAASPSSAAAANPAEKPSSAEKPSLAEKPSAAAKKES